MEITLRESERLNALITDFLLFAQPPQSHKMPWEMWKIIEETVELFTHSPSFHEGIRIRRPRVRDSTQILIDPDQMKQVFWNLLMNAGQAMSDGGEIKIDLDKRNEAFWGAILPLPAPRTGKDWVKISITDSGEGISPQDKEKIFEPFFTTKERGTGLGLSIVHKIVENHNGVIKVESEVGKGATFTIFLPAN
jgi:two-component system sensor histidine kinase PilS (NtrC family)